MPKGKLAGAPKAEPWKPADWEVPDAAALQALQRGDASDGQQRRALAFIINQLSGTYDLAYRPQSARDTDFALGKAWVGQQIVKLLHINTHQLKKDPSLGPPPKT